MALTSAMAKPHRCSAAPTPASAALLAHVLSQTWLDCSRDLQEPLCLHALGHARQRCHGRLTLTWRSQQFLQLVRGGCAIAALSGRSSSVKTGSVQQVDKQQEERTRPQGSCFAWVAAKQEFCMLVTGKKETLKESSNKKSHA